ncbi:carboxymuconolactone decarboxylase family protein [Chryseobacterium sp. B21-037]|uniref:carboxymuconolactone decarboxylase family protein n=1 Tax=unclassified Chryseobacterium TaxID=2593645 RepID=UPI002358C308|nr:MULTISPECIES: carboxymuconolactone decarboxylase family protein [unclassified Chryseobacterium]MDC8106899.1 carboxymuconolactone decarboxylase family protein [Chryseobacterium sp. B21-037]MDQ1805821.1 carboxymuconolactone decarboxylase family protein [Chryseobacterium sp. CKR4-1]
MSARVNIAKTDAAAYKAMMGLEGYLQTISLNPIQKELIKIRASQINGCAFCLDMHTKDAVKYGETPQRIYLLNAWREALELFTEEEQILLAMTEEITLISHKGLTEETYQKAKTFFDDNQIAQIIMAIVTINAWNRIAISTHLPIMK